MTVVRVIAHVFISPHNKILNIVVVRTRSIILIKFSFAALFEVES